MDDCEKAAQEYILHLGYKEEEVPYEPEGESGPDFVINRRIAVEVTRLNHNVRDPAEGKRRGEEAAIPVRRTFEETLRAFRPPTAGPSWYVRAECSLPAPGRREIQREVSKHLRAFLDAPLQEPTRLQVLPNFAIELFRAGQRGSDYFLSGGLDPNDRGELLSEGLEKNLRICIAAKAKKLSCLRSKDRESCWLALVDLVSYGQLRARDRIRIPPHGWDKIILINPLDPTQSFELDSVAGWHAPAPQKR